VRVPRPVVNVFQKRLDGVLLALRLALDLAVVGVADPARDVELDSAFLGKVPFFVNFLVKAAHAWSRSLWRGSRLFVFVFG
jgi:hypothetical protein